jgi:hypothetical protein
MGVAVSGGGEASGAAGAGGPHCGRLLRPTRLAPRNGLPLRIPFDTTHTHTHTLSLSPILPLRNASVGDRAADGRGGGNRAARPRGRAQQPVLPL